MTLEEIELPQKFVATRYDVYRFDGAWWWLNSSYPTIAAANDKADSLLDMDSNHAVRIVERTGKVVR